MLQYPTNAYPEKIAVDGAEGVQIRYRFNGDKATYFTYQITNYNTGEVASSYIQVPAHFYYNGDDIVAGRTTLVNGYDYVWRVAIAQHQDLEHNSPIYDIPVLSGTIVTDLPSNSTTATIEKNINCIYEWWGDNDRKECSTDGNKIAYGMVIQIGNERRLIRNYYRSTGLITLDSPFSGAIAQGTQYRIYSNYIISPQYYFKCRTTPNIDLTSSHIATNNNNTFYGSGNYEQQEETMIKYYSLDLHWANNASFVNLNGDVTRKIASTGNIYSQRILYEFEDYQYHDKERPNGGDYYKIVCNVVTQDNANYSEEYIIGVPASEREGLITANSTFGNVESSFVDISTTLYPDGKRVIYRRDMDTGEEVCLGDIRSIRADCTASTHGNYLYTFIGFEQNNNVYGDVGAFIPGAYLEKEVHTDEDGYYITELIEYDPTVGTSTTSREHFDNRPHYYAGDTWHFIGEINDSTITQNRDTVFHAGASKYGTVSNTDTNYMSGSLSAMLGYVNCTTKEYVDDIALVKAWREFITQNKPFMLKSQKGDVWIVNITDNPTTEYQENYYKVPTTFSFSWAECCDVRSIVITKRQ